MIDPRSGDWCGRASHLRACLLLPRPAQDALVAGARMRPPRAGPELPGPFRRLAPGAPGTPTRGRPPRGPGVPLWRAARAGADLCMQHVASKPGQPRPLARGRRRTLSEHLAGAGPPLPPWAAGVPPSTFGLARTRGARPGAAPAALAGRLGLRPLPRLVLMLSHAESSPLALTRGKRHAAAAPRRAASAPALSLSPASTAPPRPSLSSAPRRARSAGRLRARARAPAPARRRRRANRRGARGPNTYRDASACRAWAAPTLLSR